jgi:Anti-sigma-K factor rskA, C-terminal
MTHDESSERSDGAGLDVDLAAFGTTLRSESAWVPVPVDLGERVVAAVAAERAATVRTVAPTEGSLRSAGAVPLAARPSAGRRRAARWLLAAAAVAVLAFAAGLWIGGRDGDDGATDDATSAATVTLTGTELAPGAAGAGSVLDRGAGYSIRLQVDGLAPAPAGVYYEGWLRSDDGDLVSVGTFHMRGGDGTVTLWSGVAMEGYPTLIVTTQHEGADEGPGAIVLAGPVT